MSKLSTFAEAIDQTEGMKRHLLLGNGFSMACRHDIFAYAALFEQAKEHLSDEIIEAFSALGTTDFEIVMRALRQATALMGVYRKSDKSLVRKLENDCAQLREILAKTIAGNHPERPANIRPGEYESCRTFLSNFNGNIYSLNYDLLLYWTLMQIELSPSISFDDGFRTPDRGPADYVTWDIEKSGEQSVFFLHGALYIFDAGHEVLKYTWCNTGTPLVDQIRASLEINRFPLIVTEGSFQEKLTRIMHSNLLSRGYRSFSQIQHALFVFGHSLAENDNHILKLIDRGKTKKLLVGIYGDPKTPDNKRIIDRANLVKVRRSPKNPVDVSFYDAASARVWDGVSKPVNATAAKPIR